MPEVTKCGAINCNKIFEIKGQGRPALFICPDCEQKMNQGIKFFLHTHTEQIKGNFNLLDRINYDSRNH